jgi:hypothetical protein
VGGPVTCTNVLEVTADLGAGFDSAGLTNILSGGTGLGVMTNLLDVGGATNPFRLYRIRVMTPRPSLLAAFTKEADYDITQAQCCICSNR